MRIFAVLLLLVLCQGGAGAESQEQPDWTGDAYTLRQTDLPPNPPQFADYAVPVYHGPIRQPDVKSHPRSRLFRSMIRWGVQKDGVNFAGHYSLVSWGCGVACSGKAIVDVKTGQVFHPPELDTLTMDNLDYDSFGEQFTLPLAFTANSRMLRLVGAYGVNTLHRGVFYWYWNGRRLVLIRKVNKTDPNW